MNGGVVMNRRELSTPQDYLARYPRICAHIIADSLGYATPVLAAKILRDAKENSTNFCEWILSCYNGKPRLAVERAIRNRHHHTGYMASYKQALQIIHHELDTGEGPMLASWF